MERKSREEIGHIVTTSLTVTLDLSATPRPGLNDKADSEEGEECDESLELVLAGLTQEYHGADINGSPDK